MGITCRTDCEKSIEMEVLNIFQGSLLQAFLVAGLHISLSDILDKNVGLDGEFYCLVISNDDYSTNFL